MNGQEELTMDEVEVARVTKHGYDEGHNDSGSLLGYV
uniref:Uncharacterized protein n=1 Tax=Peronospora matthiolae TaxID=2874970 RepID=A0AAV1TUA0_9STRA